MSDRRPDQAFPVATGGGLAWPALPFAPEMARLPKTISHEPRKMATATMPGDGQAMIAMPVATDSRPLNTLVRLMRESMPRVSAVAMPCAMNSAPRNVASDRTVQSPAQTPRVRPSARACGADKPRVYLVARARR
jgi:hypothetical protein